MTRSPTSQGNRNRYPALLSFPASLFRSRRSASVLALTRWTVLSSEMALLASHLQVRLDLVHERLGGVSRALPPEENVRLVTEHDGAQRSTARWRSDRRRAQLGLDVGDELGDHLLVLGQLRLDLLLQLAVGRDAPFRQIDIGGIRRVHPPVDPSSRGLRVLGLAGRGPEHAGLVPGLALCRLAGPARVPQHLDGVRGDGIDRLELVRVVVLHGGLADHYRTLVERPGGLFADLLRWGDG